MLYGEWERAVKAHEVEIETDRRKYSPGRAGLRSIFMHWFYEEPMIAYSVACVFYGSEKLDSVIGIDGPDRHNVFVRWLEANISAFDRACHHVVDSRDEALASALEDVEALL